MHHYEKFKRFLLFPIIKICHILFELSRIDFYLFLYLIKDNSLGEDITLHNPKIKTAMEKYGFLEFRYNNLRKNF